MSSAVSPRYPNCRKKHGFVYLLDGGTFVHRVQYFLGAALCPHPPLAEAGGRQRVNRVLLQQQVHTALDFVLKNEAALLHYLPEPLHPAGF